MSDDELSDRQRELKAEYVSRRGHWPAEFEALLVHDQGFFERYLDIVTHPDRNGHLEPKVRDFVRIVMNSSPAIHLSSQDTRQHVANAFDHGATFDELLEVFEILCTVGVHSVIKGVPVLTERMASDTDGTAGLSADQRRVKDHFIERRGFWDDDLWGVILSQDHEFLEAYADFSAHPWEEGVLEPRVKELLYIAMDVGTPHFFTVGLGPHVENALSHGATPVEIMEVFEMQLEYGVHSIRHGLPLLVSEAERRGVLPEPGE